MQKRDAASDEELSEEEELGEEEAGEFSDSGDDDDEEVAEGESAEEEEAGEEAAGEVEAEGEEGEEGEDAEQVEEEPVAPPPKPQRKRLEPFEVPKSGAFWLHDDRFDPGEEGGRGSTGDAELDERQKERGKLWDPSSNERWGHDAFEALERGEEPQDAGIGETFGRMRIGGRGRGGRGGPGRGGGRGRGRGGRGPRSYDDSGTDAAPVAVAATSTEPRTFVVDDEDFPPPGFEHKQPAASGVKAGGRGAPIANGRGGGRGAGRGAGGRGAGRGNTAPKVLVVKAGQAAAAPTVPAGAKSPGGNRRRRGKQLNVEAQNFQPGKPVAAAATVPQPAAAPAAAPASAPAAPPAAAPSLPPPVVAYEAQPVQQMQPQQPAPAVAAAQMSAQQSAAALQQIAAGGGFAPALMQQPMQPTSMAQPMPQMAQPVQYMVQQPMQYAAAPGMQAGYAYVAVPYPAAGMQGMQMPTIPQYQPAYQMEPAPMPAAPLPPQPVKRPLTISAPDDGMAAGGAGGYAAAPAYAAGDVGGEALPQRTGAAAGGRRYSAVARQGV